MYRSGLPFLMMAILVCGQPSWAGNVYGLVVGVNEYTHITPPLTGAVNDARDVSDALQELSARDVRLLTDAEATRESIFRNWKALSDQAGEGDTLIFHFAGHGGRQDAILEGHEEKDNAFLLPGFAPSGPGVSQRIVDNEIGHLLASEQEATVVFVADTCFAGDMLRAADERRNIAVRSPLTDIGATEDPVAERVRQLGEVDEEALRRVIWLYAQDANRLTPELSIGGQMRGALSHAFGRALRGEADVDADGTLNVGELKRFVNRNVIQLSQRLQRPEVNAGSAELSINLASGNRVRDEPAEIHDLRIFYVNGGMRLPLTGVIEVDDRNAADIIFDPTDRALIYKTGDVVAQFPLTDTRKLLAEKLQGAIDKWRLIEMLSRLGASQDPDLSLGGGDRKYREGEIVEFRLRSDHHRNVVLFNLAYDGTVQLVAPLKTGGDDLFSGKLRLHQRVKFTIRVEPPFGADNLIAITAPDELQNLQEVIADNNGKRSAGVLAERLSEMLTSIEFGMNSVGLFTQAR